MHNVKILNKNENKKKLTSNTSIFIGASVGRIAVTTAKLR